MTMSDLGTDILYLCLYALAPVLKLSMSGLIILTIGESVIHAIQFLRG